MAFQWAGNELGSYLPSGSSVVENTSVGTFDPAYNRCCIFVPSNTYLQTPNFTGQTVAWFHFGLKMVFTIGGGPWTYWQAYNDSDVAVVRIRHDTGTGVGTAHLQYWNGSAWVSALTFLVDFTTSNTYDIGIDIDHGTLYFVSGGTALSATGLVLSSVVNVKFSRHFGGQFNDFYITEGARATHSTVGTRVRSWVPSANSTPFNWSGSASDVNEVVCNDATGLVATASGDKYFMSGAPVGTINPDETMRGFVLGSRVTEGDGPVNFTNALKISSTEYFGSATAQGVGYSASTNPFWALNPATSAAWVAADFDTLLIGGRANS